MSVLSGSRAFPSHVRPRSVPGAGTEKTSARSTFSPSVPDVPHELVKDNIYYYYHKEHPEYFSIQKFKRRINNKNLTAKFDVLRHNNC